MNQLTEFWITESLALAWNRISSCGLWTIITSAVGYCKRTRKRSHFHIWYYQSSVSVLLSFDNKWYAEISPDSSSCRVDSMSCASAMLICLTAYSALCSVLGCVGGRHSYDVSNGLLRGALTAYNNTLWLTIYYLVFT